MLKNGLVGGYIFVYRIKGTAAWKEEIPLICTFDRNVDLKHVQLLSEKTKKKLKQMAQKSLEGRRKWGRMKIDKQNMQAGT